MAALPSEFRLIAAPKMPALPAANCDDADEVVDRANAPPACAVVDPGGSSWPNESIAPAASSPP